MGSPSGFPRLPLVVLTALAAATLGERIFAPTNDEDAGVAGPPAFAPIGASLGGSCDLLVVSRAFSAVQERFDRHSRAYWAAQDTYEAFKTMRQFGQHLARVLSRDMRISTKWLKLRGTDAQGISSNFTSRWSLWEGVAAQEPSLRPLYSCTEKLVAAWEGLRVQERWSALAGTPIPAVQRYCMAELSWALLEIDPELRRMHGNFLDSLHALPKQVCFVPKEDASMREGIAAPVSTSDGERKRKRGPDSRAVDIGRPSASDMESSEGDVFRSPIASDMSVSSFDGEGRLAEPRPEAIARRPRDARFRPLFGDDMSTTSFDAEAPHAASPRRGMARGGMTVGSPKARDMLSDDEGRRVEERH